MLLKGKVCLIIGAGKEIGKAIMDAFVREGADFFSNGIIHGCIDDYALIMPNVTPMFFDVSDRVATKKAIVHIKSKKTKLDVLVNNAGVMKDAFIGTITKPLIDVLFYVNDKCQF